ncbi:MAG: tetraacyldisaccharide 4'-kinase, partial [Candidatus Acidiferrales bacterium]
LGDEEARHRKLFAFCGIGNPSSFVADLRDWGFQIAGHKFFPDHHRYSQRDVDELESAAHAAGAASLVCTEKDLFNLSRVRWRKCDLFVCRISMRVEREDEFWRAILTKAESRAAAAR